MLQNNVFNNFFNNITTLVFAIQVSMRLLCTKSMRRAKTVLKNNFSRIDLYKKYLFHLFTSWITKIL